MRQGDVMRRTSAHVECTENDKAAVSEIITIQGIRAVFCEDCRMRIEFVDEPRCSMSCGCPVCGGFDLRVKHESTTHVWRVFTEADRRGRLD